MYISHLMQIKKESSDWWSPKAVWSVYVAMVWTFQYQSLSCRCSWSGILSATRQCGSYFQKHFPENSLRNIYRSIWTVEKYGIAHIPTPSPSSASLYFHTISSLFTRSLAFSLVKQFVLDQLCCIYLLDLYTRHMNISLKSRTQAFSFFIIFNGSKRVGCFIRVHQVGIISSYLSILTKKFDNYNHVHMDKEVGRKFTLIFNTYNLKRKV